MIRLMVVDDHKETLAAISETLSQSEQFKVVAQSETSHEAWKLAGQVLPDIILLDLHLPGLYNTMELLKRFTTLKRTSVVIFASHGKAAEVQDLLEAGASAYVLKSDPPALLKMALLMVSKGSRGVISPSLPRYITRLSLQERTLLRYLTAKGKILKASERLGISEAEVNNLIAHLTEKLELESSDKLLRWARKHGF